MDRKPLSFFDELFPYSPWRRPSPLEIEALGGNGMVDIESLSNQNGEEISSFSKLSANSVENFSTDSNKLKETGNKTALDQGNLGFEVSRGAENVKYLSNQDGQDISLAKSLPNSMANISSNAMKLEETNNKTALEQENLDFEVSRGAENVENLSNQLDQDGQEISTSKFSANLASNQSAASISTNSKKLEETKNKIGFDQENLRFEASRDLESFLQKRDVDNENLSLPACSNEVTDMELTAKLDENNSASTGKSLSEALLFAKHGENMLCTKIVLNVRNNFCTRHVLPRFEHGIFMY